MSIFRKISWRAVIFGGLADVGGTNVVGIIFIAYIASNYGLSAVPSEQFATAINNVIFSDPVLYCVSFFIGSVFSIFGGYVAAWIAKRNELLNGGFSASLCVLIGLYSIFLGLNPSIPVAFEILSIPLSPALGVLGGYLRKKQINLHKNGT